MLRIFFRQTIQCSVYNKYGTSLTLPEQTHRNAVIEHVIDVIERSTLELGDAKEDKHERHDGKPAVCMRREGSIGLSLDKLLTMAYIYSRSCLRDWHIEGSGCKD
jgi:tRNA isopentenyl-2-thiomethyl-A-37 hydroxylase MiaE